MSMKEDRQFEYDLSRMQMNEALFPSLLTILAIGFALFMGAPLLPNLGSDAPFKLFVAGIGFIVVGLTGIGYWIVAMFVWTPRFKRKYGLV